MGSSSIWRTRVVPREMPIKLLTPEPNGVKIVNERIQGNYKPGVGLLLHNTWLIGEMVSHYIVSVKSGDQYPYESPEHSPNGS